MGPVIVPKHLSPFQKLVSRDHSFEVLAAHKPVALPVHLVPAHRPRGVRNRKQQPRNPRQQPGNQRGLPRSRRRRNNKNSCHSCEAIPSSTIAPESYRSPTSPPAPAPSSSAPNRPTPRSSIAPYWLPDSFPATGKRAASRLRRRPPRPQPRHRTPQIPHPPVLR